MLWYAAIVKGGSVVPRNSWDSSQITLIDILDNMAKKFWWEKHHPGWDILPWGSNNYDRVS